MQSFGQATEWVDPVFDGMMRLTDSESLDSTVTSISAAVTSGALPTNIELTLWALLGQGDMAMEAAWTLYEEGEFYEVEIIYLDEFRVLREHEDFPRLLESLGLTEYWGSIGCHWDDGSVICDQQSST